MNSDSLKSKFSLADKDSPNEQISRRNLLTITAKTAVGLTLAHLSSILADGQKTENQEVKVTMSDLLKNNTSVPLSSASSATSCACNFVGDINNDCEVDEEDLTIMSEEWLTNYSSAMSNLDGSYTYIAGDSASAVYVDFKDYSILANDWRKTCSAASAVSLASFRKPMQSRFASSARHRFRERIIQKITDMVTEQL